MSSIWQQTVKAPEFPTLKGDKTTDVLIIGGGIAGILTAYMLEKAGIQYILVEKDKICGMTTKDTTAKITLQHGLIFDKLLKDIGQEKTRLFYEAQNGALKEYERICKDINCDFKTEDSYVYSLENREKIEKEIEALEKIGKKAEFLTNLALPFSVAGAAQIKNQAMFNPLKFIYEISKNLKIYENTKVLGIEDNFAKTENGKIKANKFIVTTHFPFIDKYGGYFLKMYQHRSYVLALENATRLNGMFVDERDKGLSFRNYKDFLLLGGGGHRTGKKGGSYGEITKFAKELFPESREITRFATQDCITLDSIAYIGKYCSLTPNLYVATGFNKWGMTNSMLSAQILCDMITGKENPYLSVFSPQRSMLKPKLAVNIAESMMGIIKPTAPRCSHLGCALTYNKQEHTWDCSCHGSRFSQDGKVINTPAIKDKKI